MINKQNIFYFIYFFNIKTKIESTYSFFFKDKFLKDLIDIWMAIFGEVKEMCKRNTLKCCEKLT